MAFSVDVGTALRTYHTVFQQLRFPLRKTIVEIRIMTLRHGALQCILIYGGSIVMFLFVLMASKFTRPLYKGTRYPNDVSAKAKHYISIIFLSKCKQHIKTPKCLINNDKKNLPIICTMSFIFILFVEPFTSQKNLIIFRFLFMCFFQRKLFLRTA